MLVDNGEVVKTFVEEGKNNASDDNDLFEVSDVDTMIGYLKNQPIIKAANKKPIKYKIGVL